MTDRELDVLGASLLAQDEQNRRRPLPVEPPQQPPADEPAVAEWTPEQMRRLDDVFRE